jgi:hypothetical protein
MTRERAITSGDEIGRRPMTAYGNLTQGGGPAISRSMIRHWHNVRWTRPPKLLRRLSSAPNSPADTGAGRRITHTSEINCLSH